MTATQTEYARHLRIIIAGLVTHFALLLILLGNDYDLPIQEDHTP